MNKIDIIKVIISLQNIENITYNTLENLWNKADKIDNEILLGIQNQVAVLLNTLEISNDDLKNMIQHQLINELEQYVSQI